MDLGVWLRSLGLAQYEAIFRENAIDADVLHDLTEGHLREMGFPLGARLKLLKAIGTLSAGADPIGLTPAVAPAGPPADTAERRQVTVMFSDLVGSTALSARMDPEDLREVITAYQKCVAQTVRRFDGFVARYLGDGVLIYFGYPHAHEDDAERAVRAGLELIAGVVALKTRVLLQTRVGIATGLVVVGDFWDSENDIVGETPNLSARLQSIAEPNTVVIAESTRKLLGNLFDLENLGLRELKGIAKPVRAWAALRASAVESRFEALYAGGVTALVGREEECELLLRRWAEIKSGQGRVIHITGEPGIGKSRLAQAFADHILGDPHIRLRYYCTPYHTDSALYPVITQLLRAAGIEHDDGGEQRVAKLETSLRTSTKNLTETMSLLAPLLSIPPCKAYPPWDMSPQRRKERTLAALIDQIDRLAALKPLLIVFEDVHWIDPTSLELLSLIVNRIARLPVLLIITARPDFSPPWPSHHHISAMTLSRLGPREGAALALSIAKGKTLPAEILSQIIGHTDGVPLFVEELTKTILEGGLLKAAGDHYELTGPLPPLAIPATLHASLLARLDRLPSVRDVAQAGAAIGREFSYALIAAVAALPEKNLRAALERLVDAELIFRRGVAPEASYQFKHALVQDAAYGTLVRSRRQQLHEQIAQVLEKRFPDVVASEPEVLARHFTAAGLTERGVFYWQRAGQQASDRSAYPEAATHFNKALELLNQLPDTPARARRELALHVGLGAALLVTKGIASPMVERSYLKARELCSRIGETPEIAPILFGLWRYYNTRARLKTARELGEALLRLAEHDPSLSVVAHEALGCTAFWSGVFVNARQQLDEGIQRYSLNLQRAPVFRIGEDPGVGCHMYASSVLWFLGYPDQAAARMHDGLMMAAKLSHPYTLAFAHVVAALCFQMRREVAATLDQAEATIALATEHGFPHWAAMGSILGGWALAMRDRNEAGLAKLSQGIAAWRANHASVNAPYALAMQAEAASLVGHIDEGFRSLDDAQAVLEQQEDRWFEAEIYRLRGELLLQQSITSGAEAEIWLCRALDVARSQRAKSLELRAATSLAQLWRAQSKRSEARDLLSRVYGCFTEGFDTVDLKYTRALLAELSA